MTRARSSFESQTTIRLPTLTLLYLIIFNVGLCKLCWIFSRYLAQQINLQDVVNQMCEWTTVFPHDKFPQLLFFGLSLIALFVLWGGYFVLTLRHPERSEGPPIQIHLSWLIGYFIFALILNISLVPALNFFFLDLFLWTVCFVAFPLFLYKKNFVEWLRNFESRLHLKTWHYNLLTLSVAVLFVSLFYPYIFKPLTIANEFMDIPEQTILNEGKIVDNTSYINQHHLSGFQLYDPRERSENAITPEDEAHIILPDIPALHLFLKSISHSLYRYNEPTKTLSLKGSMTKRDYQQLIALYAQDKLSIQQINELFLKSQQMERSNKQRIYSAEELEFKAKNNIEIENKVKAGWLFFHHSWVLHPVLALSLGADAADQVFIYGYGVAVFLKQMMQFMHGINFQDYFKITFFFYPLYFLLFIATLYVLFKRVEYVCLGALLLSVSFFLLGPQMMMVAPGYNPMRHLFDLPMWYFIFAYFNKGKWQSLLFVLIISWLALLWSKDFGLFLSLACLGAVVLKNLTIPPRSLLHTGIALLGLIGVGILYRLPLQGVNYNFLYMLLGYMQPPITTIRISIILIVITLLYLFYILYRKPHSSYFWLALTLFLYGQLQLLYYIWHPSFQHFLVLTPIFIVGGLASLSMLTTRQTPLLGMPIFLLVTLFALYLPSLFLFCQEKKQYSNLFSDHKTYTWSFETGQFATTMDPQLFSQSLKLIHHYASASEMVLISKYDAILPIIAHRMNALPVINGVLDLLGRRDIERCVQVIKSKRPQYLFVDTDIHRDLRGDVMSSYASWGKTSYSAESYERSIAIKNMYTLFDEIQHDYRLVEQSALLSVYQHKEKE